MIKLFRQFLKPYSLSVAGALLLAFASAMFELSLPAMMSTIVDQGVARADFGIIWSTGARMLAAAVAMITASITGGYLASRNARGFGRDGRAAVFSRVSSFSLRDRKSTV